jgi:mannonate dehydratase
MFAGTPAITAGYATPSTAPGWGIEIDERLAAKHPPVYGGFERWAITVRRPDGSVEAP